MPKNVLKSMAFFSAFVFLFTSVVFAGNPSSPILPSDNIQDPGDPLTSWGGCGPSDLNCYVTTPTSQWTTTGSDIYFNGGNVGIGTDLFGGFTPSSLLDIKVSGVQSSVIKISNGLNNYFIVNSRASNTTAIGNNAGLNANNANNSNFFGVSAGSGATNANNSNFFGNNSGLSSTSANNSNFFGVSAGSGAGGASKSNFFGPSAGNGATGASNSNFFGDSAGYGTTDGYNSNFFGEGAGYNATYGNSSNFLGYHAGYGATLAGSSNFFGFRSGDGAVNSYHSNFFGTNSGTGASNASFSTFIGYHAGETFTSNNVGANNIIIGTNISLPDAAANAINIGGVLFGTGTNSSTIGDPSIVPVSGGRLGIGTVTPASKFDVTSNSLGTTQTNTDGILLANNTPAANGAQQISPAIRWSGQGWKTNATAGSQTVDFRAYLLPVQGTSTPTGIWKLQRSLNGGAYSDMLTVDSTGLTTGTNITATNQLSNAGGLVFSGAAAPIMLNGSLGTSGQVLTSVGNGTPVWTTPFAGLTNGSGTTANGTAVNLGGTFTSDVSINQNGYDFTSTTGAAGLHIFADGTSVAIGDINGNGNRSIFQVKDDENKAWYKNGSDNGFFGINTNTPTVALDVVGDINVFGVGGNTGITTNQVGSGVTALGDFNGNSNNTRILIDDANQRITLSRNITFDAYGAGTLVTDGSGNITASSDERLKDIQGPDTTGLAELMNINPIIYKWNTLSKLDTQDTYAGFSAQNVQANIPYGTGVGKNGYLTLQDRAILAATVNAIKELNIKVQGIENFDENQDSSFVANLKTWLANAGNHITRIFTGEICLADSDGSSECINKTQLQQLKNLLNNPTSTPTPDVTPLTEPENQPEQNNSPES